MSIDPLERRLEQSFEAERLTRFIKDCQDIEQLRDTALALSHQVMQQKVASAWMASRALQIRERQTGDAGRPHSSADGNSG